MRTWLTAIASALVLASCSAPLSPLRIGLLDWPPYAVARLAAEKGYFSDNIRIVEFHSPAEAARAYAVGGLDIVAITLDYSLDLHARDPDHRIFLAIDESTGGDAVISRTEMASLAELAGRRIGVESGALGNHMLSRLLQQADLRRSDIYLEFLDIPEQAQAYLDGRVDVMITYEPVRTQLLLAGGHEIFSSREMPGEIIDVFMARESAIRARPDDFRRFATGWFTALADLQQEPQASAELLAPRLGLTAGQYLEALRGVHFFSPEENRQLLEQRDETFFDGIKRFVDTTLAGNASAPDIKLTEMVSASALPLHTGAE
jgi:NitT/TauT family transport system substrate-binding protein